MINNFLHKLNKEKLLVTLVNLFAMIFFFIGISFPIIVTEKFVFFREEISVIASLELLFNSNNILLGILVLVFSILFPILKFALIFKFNYDKKQSKNINFLFSLSKYAMTEIFALAVLIVVFKTEGTIFFDIYYGNGTIYFVSSVFLSFLSTHLIKRSI